MKSIYSTPKIMIEELTKKDVLCASETVQKNGDYNIEDSAINWIIEGSL